MTEPDSLIDIIKEAYELINCRIDEIRLSKAYRNGSGISVIHKQNLEELRNILKKSNIFN